MKKLDQSMDAYVVRHLSQLKLLVRLVEHELSGVKPGQNPTLDRDLVENLLDLIEGFVEDVESKTQPRTEREGSKSQGDGKAATVTRLN